MNIEKLRKNFPALNSSCGRQKLVYLDSAATTQKPQMVIDAVSTFYTNGCANIHRAVYDLGEQVTNQYNLTRAKLAKFINAQACEIIFTSGATAGINVIASTWGRQFIKPGDEIIVSIMEHHANFIPWQQLAQQNGAVLKVINLTPDYQLDLNHYQQILSPRTKLVAISHGSNVLGVINDLDVITKKAQQLGAAVLVDAAQTASLGKIDVQRLNCDFLVFAGHKMLAPEGVGVLYIAQKWHAQIAPYQFGGGMVSDVQIERSIFLPAPEKFEAGTMPISSIIGLGAALDYYQQHIKFAELGTHLANLCARLIDGLVEFSQIKIIGNPEQLKQAGHLVSFTVAGYHAHDLAAYLGQFGICVRAGHHCAQPLHDYLGLTATLRVSFQVYNTPQEVDLFLAKLAQLVEQGL